MLTITILMEALNFSNDWKLVFLLSFSSIRILFYCENVFLEDLLYADIFPCKFFLVPYRLGNCHRFWKYSYERQFGLKFGLVFFRQPLLWRVTNIFMFCTVEVGIELSVSDVTWFHLVTSLVVLVSSVGRRLPFCNNDFSLDVLFFIKNYDYVCTLENI